MPRKPAVIPIYKLKVSLPEDLFGRLTLELWSSLENRVPLGQDSQFVERLLRQHFEHTAFDLAVAIPGLQPGIHVLRGDRETIRLLVEHLTSKDPA